QLVAHEIIPAQDTGFVRDYLRRRKRHEDCVQGFFSENSRSRFGGRICLFKAEAAASPETPKDYGWNAYHNGEFHMLDVPGSHEDMIAAPHASTLARALMNWF